MQPNSAPAALEDFSAPRPMLMPLPLDGAQGGAAAELAAPGGTWARPCTPGGRRVAPWARGRVAPYA